MATLFEHLRYFKNDGAVNALGSLEWYEAGTSTKKDTWKDAAETTPHTNPINLDGTGLPPSGAIFIRGSYKLIIKDRLGATINTIDNINEYDSYNFTGLTASVADLNSTTTEAISINTTYALQQSDRGKTLLCNASTGAFSVNLLAAAVAANKFKVIIKKIDSTLNTVTITPSGIETIDIQANYTLYDYNDFIEIHCDGSNWKLVASQIRGTIRTVTAAPVVTIEDNGRMFNCNASSGNQTINLPPCATVGRGYFLEFKKIDSSSNNIALVPNGAETIDGTTQLVLEIKNQFYGIKTDGANWFIVNETGQTGSLDTGAICYFVTTTRTKTGWVRWYNYVTIGNASSGATRANIDCKNLFILFWDSLSNTICQVLDNTGAPVARGANALADWNNNRRISLPYISGGEERVLAICPSSVSQASLAGSFTQALSAVNNAVHNHAVSPYPLIGERGSGGIVAHSSGDRADYTSLQNSGSSAPFSIMQPTIYMDCYFKL